MEENLHVVLFETEQQINELANDIRKSQERTNEAIRKADEIEANIANVTSTVECLQSKATSYTLVRSEKVDQRFMLRWYMWLKVANGP